eukprot:EC724216.1.p1 GENE.EC724216.1~~EC724216.1.p1  ORF type:complete len:148 (+),score=9.13 EC724216.1:60-503(+)
MNRFLVCVCAFVLVGLLSFSAARVRTANPQGNYTYNQTWIETNGENGYYWVVQPFDACQKLFAYLSPLGMISCVDGGAHTIYIDTYMGSLNIALHGESLSDFVCDTPTKTTITSNVMDDLWWAVRNKDANLIGAGLTATCLQVSKGF